MSRSSTRPHRVVVQAKGLLLAADGVANAEIARRCEDNWTVEWMTRDAGGSSHEIRTWVAAFSALAATGEYRMESRFYEPIPECIAGFAVAAAARA